MKKIVTGIAAATLLLGSMLSVNAATSGWVQSENTWSYVKEDGTKAVGWQQVSGKWYYLSSNGAMKTGWLQEGSTWYYLNSDGSMKTGWLQEGNKWYYLNANGSMAVNTTIDNCYVGADGSWTDSSSSSTMKEGLRPELAEEFLKLWNEERRALGLKEVKITKWAQKYADIRAEQITREFSHKRLDGLAKYGEECISWIGAPYVYMALDWFKNSEGHWLILTDPNITECGVAVYYKNGNTYVTVNTYSWPVEVAGPRPSGLPEAFTHAFKN